MLKYWIKNRLGLDFLLAILMVLLFCLAFVYPASNVISKIETENGIYLNSNIDYQIPNPSVEQLGEIQALPSVEDVFGYYLTKTTISGKSSCKINLLMSDEMEHLGFTMYNDNTVIAKIERSNHYALLDETAANSLGVKCGDTITVTVASTSVTYTVSAVYKVNSLFKEGTVLIPFDGEIKTTFLANTSATGYSAAFVSTSDTSGFDNYLKNYIPKGRLKARDQFDSDEAFNNYNAAIENGDYSNEITRFHEYRNAARKELDSAEKHIIIRKIGGAAVSGLLYLFASLMLRTRASEKKYFKNLVRNKNNLKTYRICSFVLVGLVYCLGVVLLQKLLFNSISIVLPIVITCIVFLATLVINLLCDKRYKKA